MNIFFFHLNCRPTHTPNYGVALHSGNVCVHGCGIDNGVTDIRNVNK